MATRIAPPELLDRVRLLLLGLVITTAFPLVAAIGFSARPVSANVTAILLTIGLVALASLVYRRRTCSLGIDSSVAALFVFLAVANGDANVALGLFFPFVWFRGMFSTNRRSAFASLTLACSLVVGLLVTASRGGMWLNEAIGVVPEVFLTTVIVVFIRRALESRASLEAQVRRSEAYFRSLIHDSSDVIFIVDREYRLGYHTRSAERLLGYSGAQLKGSSLASIVHPDDRSALAAFLASISAGSLPRSLEWRLRHADGTWLHVDALGRSLPEGADLGGVVLTLRNVTERKAFEQRLIDQAIHDALTDLPNRVLFQDRLAAELAKAAPQAGTVAVLFVDLDDFKIVNDTLGHAIGDQLIIAVARRLSATLRPEDLVARLGGDEFAVLAPIGRPGDAERVAARLASSFDAPFEIEGNVLNVRASIGLATSRCDGDSPDAILRHADIAMYSAKGHGKGHFERYETSMGSAIANRATAESELRAALADSQFVVHYQPILDMRTGDTVGAEALVRWQHPERGMVPPLEFIPLAEQTGMILPLGRWVLRAACEQGQRWAEHGPDRSGRGLTVSVNISAKQLIEDDLVTYVARVLAETGFDPRLLVLEVTESLFVNDSLIVRDRLAGIHALGVRVALDDFGTGYSSLAYLHQFPIDIIKIDRSFIRDLGIDEKRTSLVRSLVALGRSMRLVSVAEGVETEAQCEALREYGYDLAQGYLFARPMTAAAFTRHLDTPVERCATADSTAPTGRPPCRGCQRCRTEDFVGTEPTQPILAAL